jgi:D-alanyl-D-alanine carboxypeptidase (penicillin-binding protein 5/6)
MKTMIGTPKKFSWIWTIQFILVQAFLLSPVIADQTLKKFRPNFKAVLMADVDTGRILFAEHEHLKAYPASIVKLMSVLLTFEAIEAGKTSLDNVVMSSTKASKIGGTQVFLKEGEEFTVRELLKAMIVRSANDATLAMAEHVSGNENSFVRLMNQRAKELGMAHTEFYSPHGLPPGRGEKHNVSTAYDLYLLARFILQNHPQYLEWSAIEIDSFRAGTFQLVNTNRKLMRAYNGMDGMKTGYYRVAGFNLVSSAKRGERRLISVVMGSPNVKWRSRITSYLLDKGFNEYQTTELVAADEVISQTVLVEDGQHKEVSLKTQISASLLLGPGEVDEVELFYQLPEKVVAPVEKGSMLGTLELRMGGKMMRQIPLVAVEGVPTQSFFVSVAKSIFSWSKGDN